MASDFTKMVEYVEKAKAELDKAMGEFSTFDRMTLTETYVMGHIRAGLAVCNSARDFIMQTQTYKDQKKAPPPKVPDPKPVLTQS